MKSAGWNRMLNLRYSPFVALKNTTNRPVVLAGNPTVGFLQPKLGFKFKRIGDFLPGVITTGFIRADQMYVSATANKTYSMTLYGQVVSNLGSGKVSIEAGKTLVMSPYFDNFATYDSMSDWAGDKTASIKARPGWFGFFNGYNVDWLTGGTGNLVAGLNGNLGIIVTRDTDAWDVETTFTSAAGAWRVFKMQSDGTPLFAPDIVLEISQFPFSISSYQDAVATSAMDVDLNFRASTQLGQPMFSLLGPPTTAATLAVLDDSDVNGLSDEWEILHFNRLGVDAKADADADGFNNLIEYAAGTSPVNAADRFRGQIEKDQTGNLSLTWSSKPGRSYVIERSDDLRVWNQVVSKSASAAPASSTTYNLGPPGGRAAWFRVKLSVP